MAGRKSERDVTPAPSKAEIRRTEMHNRVKDLSTSELQHRWEINAQARLKIAVTIEGLTAQLNSERGDLKALEEERLVLTALIVNR